MPEKRTYKMKEGHFYKNIVRKGGHPFTWPTMRQERSPRATRREATGRGCFKPERSAREPSTRKGARTKYLQRLG